MGTTKTRRRQRIPGITRVVPGAPRLQASIAPYRARMAKGAEREATDGMTAHGYYDDHSEYQRKVAETGSALVRACVDAVPLPEPGETFVVADYGASTGRNSIAAVRNAIDQVRTRRPDQLAAALHNDLPTNDWNEFFTNLQTSPDSYLHARGAAGASHSYRPCRSSSRPRPPARVHVGVSFSAAHWLRTQPTVAVPDGFYFCEATGAARTALAAQADADWTAFLEARASDLAQRRPVPRPDGRERAGGRRRRRAAGHRAPAPAGDGRGRGRDGGRRRPRSRRGRSLHPRRVRANSRRGARAARAHRARRSPTRSPSSNAAPTRSRIRTSTSGEPTTTRPRYATAYAAFVRGFTESSLRTNLFAPGQPRQERRRPGRRVLRPADHPLRRRARARPVRGLDADRRPRPAGSARERGHTMADHGRPGVSR